MKWDKEFVPVHINTLVYTFRNMEDTPATQSNTTENDAIHNNRQYVVFRIAETLCMDPEVSSPTPSGKKHTPLTIVELAEHIEKGIYDFVTAVAEERAMPCDWSPLFIQMYCNKAVSIYSNLDPDNYVKNPRFRTRILNGEFEPDKVARLLPYDIYPEKWKELLDEKFKIDKNLYETRTEAATDIYKCGKCHKRVCTYFQLQTRSADEPMTTFVTCLNCGNRWKH